MQSMTGYAYNESETAETNFSVEIKSYNSRYLDVYINLPPYLGRLESRFRKIICDKVQRGKVEVIFRVKQRMSKTDIALDMGAVNAYAAAFKTIARETGNADAKIPVEFIAAQEGVLVVNAEYDMDSYFALLSPLFLKTLDAFIAERQREGAVLRTDILGKLAALERSLAVFSEWLPKMERAFREQITARFNDLLGDGAEKQRVLTETAAMLIKYTINEEIIRAQSHVSSLKSELAAQSASGRKIDFICQELNREINTIGSKNQFVEVGAAVIAAKDALENIREQTRNIE